MPAADLAARVRRGEVSATEVVAAAIDCAESVNPALNAVAVPLYEEAAGAARRLDGDAATRGLPLAGVPVTVKESFEIAGTAACGGAEALAGARARCDASVVAALRGAGAVVVAKGNLAQLMWFAETDNPVYGRTANPWAADRSPGGSSGGDAALVAAGVVPIAVGTDLGGSVRQPAHCCGIAALKPTAGRLSLVGTLDERLFAGFPWIAGQPGIFARDAGDIELVLRILDAGAAGRGTAPPPAAASPAGMRVGVVVGNGVVEPSPAVRRAVDIAAATAERAGAVAVPFAPPAAELALALFEETFRSDGGAALERALADGTAHPRVAAAIAAARGRALDAAGAADLAARIADYRRLFAHALDAHALDAVISPVYPMPAVPHGTSSDLVSGQSYCSLWNLVGYPAGVVPVTTVAEGEEPGAAGLPVGVQIAAGAWREDAVLGLMRAVGSPPPGRPEHGSGW